MRIEDSGSSLPIVLTSVPGGPRFQTDFPYGLSSGLEDLPAASTTVSRRSAVQLYFAIDEGSSGRQALDEFKARIKRRDAMKISIELIDFRGDVITAKTGALSVLD